MKNKIYLLNNKYYQSSIEYKRVKNLSIRVKNGKIHVTAPFFCDDKNIDELIFRNEKRISDICERQKIEETNSFIANEGYIIVMGCKYQVFIGNYQNYYTDKYIFVNNNKEHCVNLVIKELFKEKLYSFLEKLTLEYYSLMNPPYPMPIIKIKDVRSKWGSYNKKNNSLVYAINLLFKDPICYNYLVVHELSHMFYMDHSQNFYNVVKKFCPNYLKLRKELNH